MKKSLLALAVLTAISGAASAQSSVTLYGKIDLGLVYDAGGTAGKSLRVASGVTGGSRLGFKGVEDLGGGLKASFQLETGFCANGLNGSPAGTTPNVPSFCTGSNQFMGRQAYGALSGNFGTLSAGRQYSLGFITESTIDPFGAGYAAQANNIIDTSGTRLNNSVQFQTPSYSGFNAALEVALGERQGDWKAGRETGGALTYAQGPIYASVSYYDLNTNSFALPGDPTARKTFQGGGTYDFGVAKLHALVQSTKSDQSLTTGKFDRLNWVGGVSVPLAGGTVMASYVHSRDKEITREDATQVGVGYNYPLSKRTAVYTSFAHIIDRNGAPFTVGNATDAGTGNKSFNFGVVHNF